LKEKISLEFMKYQAFGNDFVIIDGRKLPVRNPLEVSKLICNRHFSVGCDDLLYLEDSFTADVKMRICEPDGSESSMCGNGVRCVGNYVMKETGKNEITVETAGGIKMVTKKESDIYTVNMGSMQNIGDFIKPSSHETVEERDFDLGKFYIVSPGEPHAVTVVKNVDSIDIGNAESVSKNRDIFPYGINVDFFEIHEEFIKLRTFERAIWGETLSCGTGAVSSAFIAHTKFNLPDELNVQTKGGVLRVKITDDGILQTGEARFVFKGKITLSLDE
jgi:diaminopimelate epimerase